MNQEYAQDTWLEPEEYCYPSGGFGRRARAILRQNPNNPMTLPYGERRIVKASIPDTFFSIPAKLRYRGTVVRGFLTKDDNVLHFTPEAQ